MSENCYKVASRKNRRPTHVTLCGQASWRNTRHTFNIKCQVGHREELEAETYNINWQIGPLNKNTQPFIDKYIFGLWLIVGTSAVGLTLNIIFILLL